MTDPTLDPDRINAALTEAHLAGMRRSALISDLDDVRAACERRDDVATSDLLLSAARKR